MTDRVPSESFFVGNKRDFDYAFPREQFESQEQFLAQGFFDRKPFLKPPTTYEAAVKWIVTSKAIPDDFAYAVVSIVADMFGKTYEEVEDEVQIAVETEKYERDYEARMSGGE